jgi:hypothetical protein
MEPRGGSVGAQALRVDPETVVLHDTNSSELSASIASNGTLPPIEPTGGEGLQNDEDRRKRRAAKKARGEAREKQKEQQRLEEKKKRKEARRLKREEREKRRAVRKKKEGPRRKMHHQVSYQVPPTMVMMMNPTICPRVSMRCGLQSTVRYAHGSRLVSGGVRDNELDGDVRRTQGLI